MGCRNGGLDAGESSLAEKRRAKPLAVMEGTRSRGVGRSVLMRSRARAEVSFR